MLHLLFYVINPYNCLIYVKPTVLSNQHLFDLPTVLFKQNFFDLC